MPAFFVELKQKITAHKLDKSLLPVVEVYKNKLQHISQPLKEKTNSKKNLAAAAVDGSATDNITSLCLAQMKEKGVLNLMAVVAMATTSFLENGRQVLSSSEQQSSREIPYATRKSTHNHPPTIRLMATERDASQTRDQRRGRLDPKTSSCQTQRNNSYSCSSFINTTTTTRSIETTDGAK